MRSEARADVLEHLAEHLPPAGALWAYCEAAVECDGKRRAAHGHEMRRRSQGGRDDCVHNVRLVCVECHTWIHANPAHARARGLLLKSTDPIPRRKPLQVMSRAEYEKHGYALERTPEPTRANPWPYRVLDPAGETIGLGHTEAQALLTAHVWIQRRGWHPAATALDLRAYGAP